MTSDEQPRKLTPAEVEAAVALVKVAQNTAGHFPDGATLERARRIITGELSFEEATAEADALFPVEGNPD